MKHALIDHEGYGSRRFIGFNRWRRIDDDAAGQTHEKSPKQKWFASGKASCRLLDEIKMRRRVKTLCGFLKGDRGLRSFFKRPAILALSALLTFAVIYLKKEAFFQIAVVFTLSCAFTLLLAPLCVRLERAGCGAHLSAAIAVLSFVIVAGVLLAAFVPYLVSHGIDLLMRMAPSVSGIAQKSQEVISNLGIRFDFQIKPMEMITNLIAKGTSLVAQGGVAFAAHIGRWAFSLVISYYLLCEREVLSKHILLLLPISWRSAFLLAASGCRNALLGYLSGMIKTSLFVFIATLMGLLLLGIKDALLLALFMGIFEILPYIGPILASIPIILTAMGQGTTPMLFALLVVILVQQIEGNFITPYFTASSTSIKPLSALISVFILGSLMGLWGIILAIPLVVTLRSVVWSIRRTVNSMNG